MERGSLRDDREAIKWYEKAAESGVEIAYVNLAAHLSNGNRRS